jgi:hypothetical protein
MMRVKEDFFSRGSFKIGNGQTAPFWEDTWLANHPLAKQYPSLYSVVRRKNVLVHDVLSAAPLNIEFRRVLTGHRFETWLHLVRRLMSVTLSPNEDRFIWRLTETGIFSVKSMYTDIMNGHTVFFKVYLEIKSATQD